MPPSGYDPHASKYFPLKSKCVAYYIDGDTPVDFEAGNGRIITVSMNGNCLSIEVEKGNKIGFRQSLNDDKKCVVWAEAD